MPFDLTEEELVDTFSDFGDVLSVNIVVDKVTERSKGFGFIEMADDEANDAILALNDSALKGRNLKVNKAKPPGSRSFRRPRTKAS